ncbi:MAG: (2Fe-2S) ferredoxin domain-containing protein [Acidobacteriota bacterium]
MPPPYKRHVLVCTSTGPECPGVRVLKELKVAIKKRGLREEIRAQETGCSDACEYEDCVVAVYPENVWYGKVSVEDVAEIVESHLVGGVPVARRRIDFAARTVGGFVVPPLPPADGS